MGMGRISMTMLPLPSSEIQSHVHQVDYYPLGVQLHSHAESFGKVKNLLLIFKLVITVTKEKLFPTLLFHAGFITSVDSLNLFSTVV